MANAIHELLRWLLLRILNVAILSMAKETNVLSHMVAVFERVQLSDWSYRCAGSLLCPKTVLTACHCFVGPDNDVKELLSVKLSKWQIRAGSRLKQSRNLNGGRIHPHPNCTNVDHFVDIVVISFRPPLQVDENTLPVKLLGFRPDQFKDNLALLLRKQHNCTVTRGIADIAGIVLKVFQIHILVQEPSCANQPQNAIEDNSTAADLNIGPNDVEICTDSPNGCYSDPGSPMICNGYLVGVACGSHTCGNTTIQCGNFMPQKFVNGYVLAQFLEANFCTVWDCSNLIQTNIMDGPYSNASNVPKRLSEIVSFVIYIFSVLI